MVRESNKIRTKNELEGYIVELYKDHIRLKISEQKMNNDIIRHLHLHLLQYLRRDPLFKTMYKKTFFGGSYYDGLKVSKPDEYDVNFQLEIPSRVKVISGRLLGYAQVEVQTKNVKQLNVIKPLTGENNYLAVSGVNTWFQSVVNKAVIEMKVKKTKKPFYKIVSVTSNGPAMTIVVENKKKETISVDFVPSFWFSSDVWPENCIKEPIGMNYGFCIVPKTTKDQTETNDSNFRLSFHEQERELIKHQYFLKPAVKLIKYLRDEETQTPLKSYYIKTVALWELKDSSGDFPRGGMSATFIHMLKRLQKFIESGEIPFYWNPNGLNLISDFSPEFRENLSNRLVKIIRNIEELNWDQMSIYFNT